MLTALRRVPEADRAIRAGRWKPQTGRLLGAQTVGIVGLGRIGRRVAALVQAFGAKVVGYDAVPSIDLPGVRRLALEALLAEADVITLHTPPGAVRLGEAEFSRMKQGALLVNTARGDLVDEAALHAALSRGHLGGAALDVFVEEPYSGPLTSLDTLVMTAHMGSYAAETRADQEAEAARNLRASLRSAGILP
jgi:D-3-phosphoglycerate dehydrogenase